MTDDPEALHVKYAVKPGSAASLLWPDPNRPGPELHVEFRRFCQNSGLSRHGGKLTQKLGPG